MAGPGSPGSDSRITTRLRHLSAPSSSAQQDSGEEAERAERAEKTRGGPADRTVIIAADPAFHSGKAVISVWKRVEAQFIAGEIALAFADVQSSTALWEALPDSTMTKAIDALFELLREGIELVSGYEVKAEGDSMFAVFDSVARAAYWCLWTQAMLLEVDWPREMLAEVAAREELASDSTPLFRGLRLRMGVHRGRPNVKIDSTTGRMAPDPSCALADYFGPVVNKAARVAGLALGLGLRRAPPLLLVLVHVPRRAAAGGQIVLSRSTFDAMVAGESAGVGFSLGEDTIPGLSLTPIDRRTDRGGLPLLVEGVDRGLARSSSRRRATLPPNFAPGRGGGGAGVFRAPGADTWSAHPQAPKWTP
eukprot:tig00020563_g11287.t1